VRTISRMRILATLALLCGLAACQQGASESSAGASTERAATAPEPAAALGGQPTPQPATDKPAPAMAIATFANGCFWCTEAVFEQLRGVTKVVSGYIGGAVDNPTYKEVCNGTTGHAEALQVEYDPAQIDYATLLEVFWKTHDPTTLNRQGNDVGTQYRSGIFFHDAEQERLVTEVSPAVTFWPAEDYHQGYFESHGHEPYCQYVVAPKVTKFMKAFPERLRSR